MRSLITRFRSSSLLRLGVTGTSIFFAIMATPSAVIGLGDMTGKVSGLRFIAIEPASASQPNLPPADRRAAIEQILKHIYAVYLGIRSCTEISAMQNDNSFRPEVSLDESRQVLRQVDMAAREVGINSAQVWYAEAPIGLITAEALKTHPETHLVFCQKMGSLFRIDAGNLQANLAQFGAKTPIIIKDY